MVYFLFCFAEVEVVGDNERGDRVCILVIGSC